MCLLTNDVTYYNFVSQGKTEIPSVDDGEELSITDVSSKVETQNCENICLE